MSDLARERSAAVLPSPRQHTVEQTTLSASTLAQHHAILTGALKAAAATSLVTRNVAALVIGKPQARRDHDRVLKNCWEADEAARFLAAAKAAGPQPAALFALALDSGARKNELCGLQWQDLDLERSRLTVMRQLTPDGHVAPHVVQQRLGHKKIATTLDIYAHALPSVQRDAAQRLGALLYGAVSKP